MQAVRDNGTYDVVYEDGSQDECLEEVYLTPAMHGVSEAQTLAPGLLLSALSRVQVIRNPSSGPTIKWSLGTMTTTSTTRTT